MASKFGLAGGIPERRVRPIWDAIDSRQFKNALKLVTTLLSKFPNSPYALALKALVLERTGKNEEALSVSLNAKEILFRNDANILVDDLTLSTLQIVFQRLDHLEMATSCYEHACGKYTNNLELMIGLFNCYVREYSFVKQQQIAIKMYKIAGEERFLLWAVCSIQLQVFCGSAGHNLFVLAEGLLKKHIASHSLHEPEALSVYICLLEQQSKYRDALDIISGDLGSLMGIEADKLRLQGRLLARAEDYVAAADVFQKALEICPDDWECFLQYLGCLLEDSDILTQVTNPIHPQIHPQKPIESKNLQQAEEVFDLRVSSAVNFINKLMEDPNNNSLRSPYLALLEIERQKILRGKSDAGNLTEDLVQYFMRFGHLTCFASDVETFLEVLDNDKKRDLLKKLLKEYEATMDPPTKALGQSLTIFKIQNLIGDMFSLQVNDLEDLAVRMLEMFCKNLPLSKELDAQESLYGEELLSMACNVLVQLFWRTRDLGYLLESIMILEFGLTLRRFVWQYKILLVHLYSYWSCLPLAYERYKSLDVKNILVETMSHHILPQMVASPLWTDLNNILSDYLKFMDDHFRESADLTFIAYRHRNYSKVVEFVQFKQKLQRSGQYLIAKIEGPLLQLKQNANNIDEEESLLERLGHGVQFVELSNEIRSKTLTFNEDTSLRPWWTPTCDKNYLLGPFEEVSYTPRGKMHTKDSEANVLKSVEKRSLLPRMIYLSMQSASGAMKEKSEANGKVVDPKLSLELKSLLERYANIMEFPFQDAIECLVGASRDQNPVMASSVDVVDWMNFAVFLNAWNLNSHEIRLSDKDNSSANTWHLTNSLMKKYVTEKINSACPVMSSPGKDLSVLMQLVTEPLAWHSLILQSCVRSLVPSGKKKKKGGAIEHSNSQLLHEITSSIQSLSETIEMVTKWLREQICKPNDEKFDSIYSTILGDESSRTNGPGKVFKALESSVTQMKDVELGQRLFDALKAWNPADVSRKIIDGQGNLLTEVLKICESKIKLLQKLRLQL